MTTVIIIALIMLQPTFMNSEIIQITSEDQYNQAVLNNHSQALVQFSAEWCSICQGVKKPLEQISKEKEFAKVTFARVDIDQMNDFSKKNGVVGVPSFLFLENGNKKHEEIGVQNMNSFRDNLRNTLRKTFKVAEDVPQSAIPESVATTIPQPTAVKSDVTPQEKEHLSTLSQKQVSDLLAQQSPETKPMVPTPPPVGIMEQIIAFFTTIANTIKEWFMAIIDWIKGLFGF